MIYICMRHDTSLEMSFVNRVYEINTNQDVEALYLNFLAEKAKEIGIIINPHWGNLMNRENHHPHLTVEEYKQKDKEWTKFLRQWNIRKFIVEVLKGKKVNYKTINRF